MIGKLANVLRKKLFAQAFHLIFYVLLNDDGVLQAITGQQPFEIGSMAMDAAVKALKGQTVEKKASLPGVLLTRGKPDEIRTFRQRLKELSR